MRNSRNLVLIDDVQEVGRALADVPPRKQLAVPPSGQSGIVAWGGKCAHGMYIPATSPYPDHSEYCSICRPFEIAVRQGGIYKA